MTARVTGRVWAPNAQRARLAIDGDIRDLRAAADGWWELEQPVDGVHDYGFLLDDDATPLPDPRSQYQPEGVHGLSRSVDLDAHRSVLDAILDELDESKRAVFVLYELEELPMAEVAAAVGCPLQTAYSRLHSARATVESAVKRRRAREGTP